MKKLFDRLSIVIGNVFSRLGLGMRAKLILLFVVIKVIPLVLLTIMAWGQSVNLGKELNRRTQELTVQANEALIKTGDMAVSDSVTALNNLATEDIERTSTDMARRVADFLYERDRDILYVAALEPGQGAYRRFVENKLGTLIKSGEWELAADGRSWVPRGTALQVVESETNPVGSSNRENDYSFRYRPPDNFAYENRPLYLEMTYVDLQGNELIKVTGSPRMDRALKNVADRRNTYVKAETYFGELKNLKPGEIYVSDVIGAYVPSHLIGMYTPENTAARGLEYRPEEEAYAGKENPWGKRFQGLIRWATPVVQNGRITGYVTLALDHDHIMEFTDHTTPMSERYMELPSAFEGNYAFIWDYKCRSIAHPRHHSIVGFNPETGEAEVPWLEESIYQSWQASGKPYTEFIKGQATFVEQSRLKKPSAELTAAGLVGLDGRYLNNAPQCTGWFDLTSEGGSGSFLILWSGLWKLTTAATIPYYTGHYGESKRGFGFVAIGAGFEDFQHPALETKEVLDGLIGDADRNLTNAAFETSSAIKANLLETTIKLVVSAGLMIILVVFIAIWIASAFTGSITNIISGISHFRSGERQFRFNAPVKDEIGTLMDSFDEMADSLVAVEKDALVITRMDGAIIYANHEALVAIKKEFSEIQGKPYGEISIYPEDSNFDPLTALHEGREADVLYLSDTKRYVRGSAAYLTDKEGKNIGYIVTTTDLTEIVEEQKKIEEQKTLLDTIFSASPDLIWYKDIAGRYLTVNPRFASAAGREADEIVGSLAEDVFSPENTNLSMQRDLGVIESRKPLYSEERLVFADGHEEVLDMVRTPIFDSDNNPVGVLGFARDVSVRVNMENELRKTQIDLEKAVTDANNANRHKGDFLARMSHEIRTPMNAIIGMTGIVKKKLASGDADMEDMQANLRQIETSSQHLLGLLNDILDISKIEAGKIELSDETVDMKKLARTVETIIKPRCDEKNIIFDMNLEISPPGSFKLDPLRLRQVLINLLGNAVKFTPECGRIEFSITEQEKRDGKTLVGFLVRDNGIGIPKGAQEFLFKPFEQASAQTAKTYGGTGLGLAISKNIVQLFGGDIALESEEGKGSAFSFSLWFSDEAAEQVEELSPQNTENRLAGKKALLVDDVEINRLIAVNLLEFTGIEFDEAEDGIMAVKKFNESAEHFYDIIYMDVQMPNMDGYEATTAIRALDRADAKTVPIVALTANAFKDDIDRAIASGMNAHLAKPLELDKFTEVSFKLLGIRG
ncbi:signal transduction histidine kinase [Treponema primitia ZAS-2]|uniref:histidine kinase n=1 Tax=Treponema primitia (strain ATCC BAA-887 / DSM 12427 / ZAS-2) TaxID=545694 RepID=F5YNV2_TREPZ|nr:ATP-binding protein [Treponema primitia]AEF84425.1 signal transduction histidine kinase [Treponema primitia ZAS-2]